jgi:hypothetical protein
MHFDSFAKRNLSLEAFLRQAGPGQRPAAPQSGAAPASAVPPAAASPATDAPSVRSGAATGRSPGVATALN